MAERSSASTQSPAHGPGYEFRTQVFYDLIDCVRANIHRRFDAAEKLNNTFCVLWKYLTIADPTIKRQARALFKKYSNDISKDIIYEIKDSLCQHLIEHFGFF